MLTGEIKEMAKAATGLNDEQIEQMHPGQEKLFNNVIKTSQYQIVAEVIKSEHCFAQVQVGDKIVFDPFLNTEKSKGVMCPKALLPLVAQIGALWEMSMEWAESGKEESPEIVWRNIRCLDPGLEDGGTGGVVYNIQMEKIEA
jgi:hypothetical protein